MKTDYTPPPVMWGALYWHEMGDSGGSWLGTSFASKERAWKEHLLHKETYRRTSFVRYDGTVVEAVGPCE